MRFLLPAACAFCLLISGGVVAQVNTCIPPDAGLGVAGAAAFNVASAGCKKVDYSSPLGPLPAKEGLALPDEAKKAVWQPPERETARIVVPQPTDEADVPEKVDQNYEYNYKQFRRLGELDAQQGKPMNMKYAGNLGYLKGYTEGQDARLKRGATAGEKGVR